MTQWKQERDEGTWMTRPMEPTEAEMRHAQKSAMEWADRRGGLKAHAHIYRLAHVVSVLLDERARLLARGERKNGTKGLDNPLLMDLSALTKQERGRLHRCLMKWADLKRVAAKQCRHCGGSLPCWSPFGDRARGEKKSSKSGGWSR